MMCILCQHICMSVGLFLQYSPETHSTSFLHFLCKLYFLMSIIKQKSDILLLVFGRRVSFSRMCTLSCAYMNVYLFMHFKILVFCAIREVKNTKILLENE